MRLLSQDRIFPPGFVRIFGKLITFVEGPEFVQNFFPIAVVFVGKTSKLSVRLLGYFVTCGGCRRAGAGVRSQSLVNLFIKRSD